MRFIFHQPENKVVINFAEGRNVIVPFTFSMTFIGQLVQRLSNFFQSSGLGSRKEFVDFHQVSIFVSVHPNLHSLLPHFFFVPCLLT
uniref:Uncharacterized protein n=1 Tax=Siphoviridae sp. ctxMM9 TaxID=2827973 RepID=A0A8S5T5V5_9CAUD|nr:MAG TPA: hypothetical protein [Siphoviridae sp. ctxMM9]